MNTAMRCATAIIFSIFSYASLFAGGSGLNVVVVVNQNSTNSLQLGNYYCEQRGVPPQNVLRVNWTGGNTDWTRTNLDTVLRGPLNAMLASRQLTNQVEYILLSMDIPYRVTTTTNGANSTTSTLFYGFKPDSRDLNTCPLALGSTSLYAGSEGIFRQTPPVSATSNAWLVMMLTSSSLAAAKRVVDQGVASDGNFSTQTVWLAKSTDVNRNVRYPVFDHAVFDTRLRGNYFVQRTNSDSPLGLTNALGYQNGLYQFSISTNTFVPGAMADSLTSYGGGLFDPGNTHTKLLAFLGAGASGSYGTVVEPCNYLAKFPDAKNYFYQSRGFSLAECYYMSVTNPYQGLLVGEPLAAPFALPCSGAWSNLPPDALLSGTTNLSLHFTAANPGQPVQQVDLFLDGTIFQTLTNIPPARFNVLYVTLPGKTNISYTVPLNATVGTVASGLVNVLDSPANKNTTKVSPFLHGDRIELRSTDANRSGSETFISVSNYISTATALTTFIGASRTSSLDTIACGIRQVSIGGTMVLGDYLHLQVTKTNGAVVPVGVTNSSPTITLQAFVQSFLDAINADSALQGPDGLAAEDMVTDSSGTLVEFNLRARAVGMAAAQLAVLVSGTFSISPATQQVLDGNLADLQPRNHIYITAGVTNLFLSFPFNTTTHPDGWHELTAVAYEGSHVRTQKRVSQTVRIQNTPLGATFTCLLCDTNTGLEATMQFLVAANTNNITSIELFSTGGSWGVVSNQPSATFSLAATNLGLGLHPFYALVTRNDGKQYRTETKWIRLIGDEPPFTLGIAGGTPTVSWPATAGRRYEILSATNATHAFVLRDAVTPTNSPGQWSETNNSSPQRLYRVRTAP
ncbi:MAG: TIGR03790 family protein [Verrucomicrobia bacterium]|nr:TIGR03790 family protein [Verrucomicrobiota bacterium]